MLRFEWNEEKNQGNIIKHGIDFETAIAIFKDSDIFEWHDVDHSGYNKVGEWEDRYAALGWVNNVLYIVYTIREQKNDEVIRIISARKALQPEIKKYEEWVRSRHRGELL